MSDSRPSDFDVTGTVQVSCPHTVCEAVHDIFAQLYPDHSFDKIAAAFEVFRRLFVGELPGFRGCDTVYHDMQHTLDMTLAMTRLIGGWEKAHEPEEQLGFENASLGIVTALFHDSGYIVKDDDDQSLNGAEYTRVHITRGANFLRQYLPTIGLDDLVEHAAEIIHFTGYEKAVDEIETEDPKHRVVGMLLGTADLMAQMADRCYLEKCRDRLYSEFVLGGVAVQQDGANTNVTYESGLDLLKKTPEFFDTVSRDRLDGAFEGVHKYFRDWFGGEDPYHYSLQQNLSFLERILEHGDWSILRRRPPVFTHSGEAQLEDTQEMVALRLKDIQAAVD